jgi:hypothetical protein
MQGPSEKTISDDKIDNNIDHNSARRWSENGAKKAYRLEPDADARPSYSPP